VTNTREIVIAAGKSQGGWAEKPGKNQGKSWKKADNDNDGS